jgi:hypothetical protein
MSTDMRMYARTDIFIYCADRGPSNRTGIATSTNITITASTGTRTGSRLAQ